MIGDYEPGALEQRPTFTQARLTQQLEQSKPEVGPSDSSEYHFALSGHSVENSEDMAEAVQDCDVIAIECVGARKETKDITQAVLTHYLRSGTTPEQREQVLGELHQIASFPEAEATLDALIRLGKTDKQVVLVDVDNSLEDQFQAREAMRDRTSQLMNDCASNARVEASIADVLTLTAEIDRQREATIVEQLKQLSSLPRREDRPLRVGIIIGARHSSVYHQLAKEGYRVNHEFVDPTTPLRPVRPEKFRYSYSDQAIRSLVMQPEKPINPQLLERITLTMTYWNEGMFGSASQSEIQAGLVDKMTDEEVSDFMQRLDEVKGVEGKSQEEKRAELRTELSENYVHYNKH